MILNPIPNESAVSESASVMHPEFRDNSSERSSLSTKKKSRSHSHSNGTKENSLLGSVSRIVSAGRDVLLEDRGRERERERKEFAPVSGGFGHPYANPDTRAERYPSTNAFRRTEKEEMPYLVSRENDCGDVRHYTDKYGRPISPDAQDPPMTIPYPCDSYQPMEKGSQESQGRQTGATFSIGLGKHSFSGGIHFGKKNHEKRSPSFGSSTHVGSKPATVDHLAYGTFDENHLAYPDPPSRNHEKPLQRPYAQLDEPTSYPDQRYYSTRHDPSTSSASQTNSELAWRRDPSPDSGGLARHMHSLGINSGHNHSGIAANYEISNVSGSPLLEPYHGTYQSISPMPSPVLPSTWLPSPTYLEPLSPKRPSEERGSKKSRSSSIKPCRKARFHDPEEEASLLAEAIRGENGTPDTAPLISILPGLTHPQILELRTQYRRLVKTGTENKDVNIAKHIKLRLKNQPGLMKACYACALGRWESEAYWVSFWYQSERSRKEFLIESLMGRTNEEIRVIKKGFRDKKYDNSLSTCMRKELRDDKFRKAIMLVLEERRMEERLDGSIDYELVDADVRELRKAIRSERGGESAVIEIIVLRSDTHLREVLKAYRKVHGVNLAKALLKKSVNLVGELLAHILNGVINVPVRDALLLHHALSRARSDPLHPELLISRLVRYHWDRPHLELVRTEFRHLYSMELQTAVSEGVPDELGAFLEALCVRRTEDDVRVL